MKYDSIFDKMAYLTHRMHETEAVCQESDSKEGTIHLMEFSHLMEDADSQIRQLSRRFRDLGMRARSSIKDKEEGNG